jgi:hypothetical protein
MATARLDRKGFLKSLGVAAAALVARPAAAAMPTGQAGPAGAKAPGLPLVARKAAGAVARRGDLV